MKDIAYQNKDITSKLLAESLRGKPLSAFGLPELRIVEILPTNLPVVESNELRLDNLFLLNDGSVAILDYESTFRREQFVKYLNYIARVVKRYSRNHGLARLTRLRMVVIYTADVERADSLFDLGGIILSVDQVFLLQLDTEAIYEKVRARVEHNQDLTDEELLELMVYPLSIKGNAGKQQGILAAAELAKRLPRQSQALHALAGILTFSDKVIDREYKKKIEEEMKMTQIGQMLIDEGIVMGRNEGIVVGRSEGRLEGIQAMILENLEEKTPEKRIVGKLQKHFSLTQEEAGRYVREFITGQRP